MILSLFGLAARLYMGGVFLFACIHKMADPAHFALNVATYDILPLSLVNLMAVGLPWVELSAAIMVILGWKSRTGALMMAGMMVMFMAALSIALWRGLDMTCGCFAATGAEAEISGKTLVRDAVWLLLSLFIVFFDKRPIGLERFMKTRFLFVGLLAVTVVSAETGESKRQKALMQSIHLYACTDKTIAEALESGACLRLARRLRNHVNHLISEGKTDAQIRDAILRRGQSVVRFGPPAEIDLQNAPFTGDTTAPVRLVAYICARCPFCRELIPELEQSIQQGKLKGKAVLYYRIFPIKGHPGAVPGGLAMQAAHQLGHFQDYLNLLYGRFDVFTESVLDAWAEEAGMDPVRFEAIRTRENTRSRVVEQKKEGLVNGVKATPTFFINGTFYTADLDRWTLTQICLELAENPGRH